LKPTKAPIHTSPSSALHCNCIPFTLACMTSIALFSCIPPLHINIALSCLPMSSMPHQGSRLFCMKHRLGTSLGRSFQLTESISGKKTLIALVSILAIGMLPMTTVHKPRCTVCKTLIVTFLHCTYTQSCYPKRGMQINLGVCNGSETYNKRVHTMIERV